MWVSKPISDPLKSSQGDTERIAAVAAAAAEAEAAAADADERTCRLSS